MLNQHCAFNIYVIIWMLIDKLRTHFKPPLKKSVNIVLVHQYLVYDPVPAMFYLVFYGCGLEGHDALVTSQETKLTTQFFAKFQGFIWLWWVYFCWKCNQRYEDKEAHYIFQQWYHFQQEWNKQTFLAVYMNRLSSLSSSSPGRLIFKTYITGRQNWVSEVPF